MFTYRLAERLGRTVEEIGQMSNLEYIGWQALAGYDQLQAQREQMKGGRRAAS